MFDPKTPNNRLQVNMKIATNSQEKEALNNLMEIDFNNDAKDGYNPFNALYDGSSDNLNNYLQISETPSLKNIHINKEFSSKIINTHVLNEIELKQKEIYKKYRISPNHSINKIKKRLEKLKKNENDEYIGKPIKFQAISLSDFLGLSKPIPIKEGINEDSKLKNPFLNENPNLLKQNQLNEISNWSVNNLNDMEKKINAITDYGKFKLSMNRKNFSKQPNKLNGHDPEKNKTNSIFSANKHGVSLKQFDSMAMIKHANNSNINISQMIGNKPIRPRSNSKPIGIKTDRKKNLDEELHSHSAFKDSLKKTTRKIIESSRANYETLIDGFNPNKKKESSNQKREALRNSISLKSFNQEKIIANCIGETNFNSIKTDTSKAKKTLHEKITNLTSKKTIEDTKNTVKDNLKLIFNLTHAKKFKDKLRQTTKNEAESSAFTAYNKYAIKQPKNDHELSRNSLNINMSPDYTFKPGNDSKRNLKISIAKNYPKITNNITELSGNQKETGIKFGNPNNRRSYLNDSISPYNNNYLPVSFMPHMQTKRHAFLTAEAKKKLNVRADFSNIIAGQKIKPGKEKYCNFKLADNSQDINLNNKNKTIDNECFSFTNSLNNSQYDKFAKYKNDF